MARKKPQQATLEQRRILLRFISLEFGYEDAGPLLDQLRDVSPDVAHGDVSGYAMALSLRSPPLLASVAPEQLAEYDRNIAEHSRRLRMTRERGRAWKPHQYLALLFTERYLHRYFEDAEELRKAMNRAKRQYRLFGVIPDYTENELRTIAFQSATGSGKTLIMHAHILQYQHWLKKSGGKLNNIILLTPNEQMSRQHERELRMSGIEARLFSSEARAGLFRHVEIIDLNKLAEKRGVKRVAVQEFGENNLVLVDEGHLGATGKVWRERREELSRGGFTFEYSATFNQVVTKDKSRKLLIAYGKALLFDYSYSAFYEDGYGKDYTISNLPGGMEDASSNLYLLGCLLTFYRQCRAWRDHGGAWREFNLTKPLWVFLGKTVIGKSQVNQQARTDIVRILEFLGWCLVRGAEVRSLITRLVNGDSGLVDEAGNDYFSGRFVGLESQNIDALYDDIRHALFNGGGQLHVRYLTSGDGELHLRAGDNAPFGVVNVGDSQALYNLLLDNDNPDLAVEREAGFVEKMFDSVDQPRSPVNIVVGARRFIAGWSSWRVSTMGLMHVGVGEGPEIIQMFGRGVRLKGWNMSLKRHGKCGAPAPAGGDKLAELETLHIFGLRSNYMQTFKELLRLEGIQTERETVRVPVTWNFAKGSDLKMLRLDGDLRFENSQERVILGGRQDSAASVVRDLYSSVQSAASGESPDGNQAEKSRAGLAKEHVALFNRTHIYEKLLAQKRYKGWHNLIIEPELVEDLLASSDWYELYAPPERMKPKNFKGLLELEDLAVSLLTEYIEQVWRNRRRRWEQERLRAAPLDESDPNNIREYQLSMDAPRRGLNLTQGVRGLQAPYYYIPGLNIRAIVSERHAYQPLLHRAGNSPVTVQPVTLDDSEREVVEKLISLADQSGPCLRGRELFLIRNQSRGRGVSFFDDFAYYPDFIVWLKQDGEQHVLFLDPKGLVTHGRKERNKVKLHTEIKETEKQVRKQTPGVHLHAYVLSVTPPDKIGDEKRSKSEWADKGVYFLGDSDCLEQIIEKVLGDAPPGEAISSN